MHASKTIASVDYSLVGVLLIEPGPTGFCIGRQRGLITYAWKYDEFASLIASIFAFLTRIKHEISAKTDDKLPK